MSRAEEPLVSGVGAVKVGWQELQAAHGGGVTAAHVEDAWDGGVGCLVKDPRLERVVEAAGHDDGLPWQELDLADAAADGLARVDGWVVGAPQHAHNPAPLVEIPECDVSAQTGGRGHDTVLAAVLTGSLAVGSERYGCYGGFVVASVETQNCLVCVHILDDQGSGGVGDGEKRQGGGRLEAGDGAAVGRGRE